MTSLAPVAVLVALLIVPACGSPDAVVQGRGQMPSATSSSASAVSDPAQCTTVDAPMVDVAPLAVGEPTLAVPAPPGWKRNTQLDSNLIRITLVNTSLAANGFAPNVVGTLEVVDGEVSAEAVFDQERAALTTQGGATDLQTTKGTLCGLPAETTDYTGAPQGAVPARPVTVLLSALETGGRTYALAVTIQTTEPDNPTYVSDRNTILSGFRFLAPGA